MTANSTVVRINHVNFPMTDPARTQEWYGKVFGMTARENFDTNTLLLTNGIFGLYFTPVVEGADMKSFQYTIGEAEIHFAIEVEDFDGFLAYLDSIGVPHSPVRERPKARAKMCELRDPDGTMIEIEYHPNGWS